VVKSISQQVGPQWGVFSIFDKPLFLGVLLILVFSGCTDPPPVVALGAQNYFTNTGAAGVKVSGLCKKGLQVTITTASGKSYASQTIPDLEDWSYASVIPVGDRSEFLNGSGTSIEAVCLTADGRTGRSKRVLKGTYSSNGGFTINVLTAQTEERPESYMLESPAPPIEVNGSAK
jgi:hypothetical protein